MHGAWKKTVSAAQAQNAKLSESMARSATLEEGVAELSAFLEHLGSGNSIGLFWPENWPTYRPENWPEVPFENDTYMYFPFLTFWAPLSAIFTTVVLFLIQ